ncbi:MAG: FISUMP domain-containing protein [Bacteroidota bacterium]
MKRMSLVLFIFLVLFSPIFAQKFLMKLTFTGKENGTHINLDSIYVKNLTQNADTILYWPDTTLSFVFSGVGIPGISSQNEEFSLKLLRSARNGEDARVGLSLPEAGKVEFCFFYMTGSLIGRIEQFYEAGTHSFRLSGGKGSAYLLSVRWKNITKTIKIMNSGAKNSGPPRLQYEGNLGLSLQGKFPTMTNSFPFAMGDSLKFTAYYGTLHTRMFDNPSQSTNYTFLFGMNFSCPETAMFSYGGQTYNTVKIGNQCWMKENLNIGTIVSSVYINSTSHSECADNGIIEKYCYQNLPQNCDLYGGLYDWNEMMQYISVPGTQGICPSGWHVPTDGEWQVLVDFLGGSTQAGGMMKEAGFVSWNSPNTGASNLSGFTALGAGYRFHYGNFGDIHNYESFWSSTEYSGWASSFRYLMNTNSSLAPYNYFKTYGYSVRCVLNE